jgi:DNA invertase Pin-like site-specific DNA recombinase
MKIGYARISRDVQDLGKQVAALELAGCDRIYQDTISGTKASRPELDKMMASLQRGDTLVIHKLDRLGRSVRHLYSVVDDLRTRGVGFVSLGDSIDIETPAGRMVFGMLAVIAEFERELIRERTCATIAHLRATGVQLGRKPSPGVALALELIRIGKRKEQVIREAGIKRGTYYRLLGLVQAADQLP